MPMAVLISLLGLLLAGLIQLAFILIWGGRLDQRVKALEDDMKALKELPIEVAKLQTQLGGLLEQFKDLNASIRWMREPSPPYAPGPARRVTDKDEGR